MMMLLSNQLACEIVIVESRLEPADWKAFNRRSQCSRTLLQ
jgi:hypothetical protein